MTPAQCRAARRLVGMSIGQLSVASLVPLAEVWGFEAVVAPHMRSPSDIVAMRAALERAGVEFTEDGPRLRRSGEPR